MADKVPLDQLGRAFTRNLAHIRQQQSMTYGELSRQLTLAHWPIPPLGLRRIEDGERKISIDDAAAIAQVLGVTLAELLLDAEVDPQLAGRLGLQRVQPERDLTELIEVLSDVENRVRELRGAATATLGTINVHPAAE